MSTMLLTWSCFLHPEWIVAWSTRSFVEAVVAENEQRQLLITLRLIQAQSVAASTAQWRPCVKISAQLDRRRGLRFWGHVGQWITDTTNSAAENRPLWRIEFIILQQRDDKGWKKIYTENTSQGWRHKHHCRRLSWFTYLTTQSQNTNPEI